MNNDLSMKAKHKILSLYTDVYQFINAAPDKKTDYLEMLSILGESFGAYLCGMVQNQDEAFEIFYEQKEMEKKRLVRLAKEFSEQKNINKSVKDALNDFIERIGNGEFYRPEELVVFGVPEEKVKLCFVSLNQTLEQMAEKKEATELYAPIISQIKPEYRNLLQQFMTWSRLIDNRRLNMSCLLPDTDTKSPLAPLHYFHNWLSLQQKIGVPSESLSKAERLWYKIAYTGHYHVIKEMAALKTDSPLAKRIQTNAEALLGLFNPLTDKEINVYLKKLKHCLRSNFDTVENSENLLKSFNQSVNFYLKDKNMKQTKTTGVIQKSIRDFAGNESKEKTESQPMNTESLLDYIFSELTDKYAFEKYSNPNAVFSVMHPYEVLFFMGILNYHEYNLCKQYKTKTTTVMVKDTENDAEIFEEDDEDEDELFSSTPQYIPETVLEDRTMPEIFEAVLDSEKTNHYVLPLKKEYLSAVEQIRLAGVTAFLLSPLAAEKCMDIDFSHYSNPDPLKEEGLFLCWLIQLTQSLPENAEIMKQLTVLSDGYWKETVTNLKKLPIPDKRPELANQIALNIKWLDNVSSSHLKSFKTRKPLYTAVLTNLHTALINLCDREIKDEKECYAKRSKILKIFSERAMPFETKRLKMERKDWLKAAIKRCDMTFIRE